MTWLRALLRNLWRRSSVDRALDDEVRACLEILTNERIALGASPAEARRQAARLLGGVESVKESTRAATAGALIHGVLRDIQVGLRSLRTTPNVTAMAVASLALAIGANTAAFSVVNSLMLRDLPVPHPENLVLVTDGGSSGMRAWSYPIWEQIRARPDLVESSGAWSFARLAFSGADKDERVDVLWATGSLLQTLGVGATVGRTLSVADDRLGGGVDGPVVMISHAFWQGAFGGASDVIGRVVRLNGVPCHIVGVTQGGFSGPEVGRAFDVMLPLGIEPLVRGSNSLIDSPDSLGTSFLTIVGCLRQGQSLQAAADAFRIAQPAIRAAAIATSRSLATEEDVDRYVMRAPLALVSSPAGSSSLRRGYAKALMVTSGIVALVLLLACVNLANLLLSRSATRRHEVSVRLALGASRMRLVRQFLIESSILAAIGAVGGLLLGAAASHLLVSQLSTSSHRVFLDLSFDTRLLLFTICLTGLTTLLFGIVPAFRAVRVAPIDALKDYGRALTEQGRRGWPNSLVVIQVALSLVLVFPAALFTRSLSHLTTRDLGFQPEQVLEVTMDTPPSVANSERLAMFERTREAVRALPDVAAVGLSLMTPISGGGFTPPIEVSGVTAGLDDGLFGNLISPGWFDAMGTSVLVGRDFDQRDRHGTRRVAVVNETFVAKVLGGASPFGRTITLFPNRPIEQPPMEIVGVVGDAVYTSLRDEVPPTWYAPIEQFELLEFPFSSMNLSLRSQSGMPASLVKSVDAAIQSVDSRIASESVVLEERVRNSLRQERLLAQMAGFFGALGVLLAGVGLYGVTAHAVARRRREIGIRIALGAAAGQVVRLVVRQAFAFIMLGIATGVAISLVASEAAAGLIYQVGTRDPLSFLTAVVLLASVGALAAWLPARRATQVDPAAVPREG